MKKSILTFLLIWLFGSTYSQDNLSSGPQEITGLSVEQFNSKITVKGKLVLVNFKANWCVVCKKQKPVLNEIQSELGEKLVFIEIDMERNPLIAEYFEVDGLPVNLIYKNGTLVWNRMGMVPKKEMLAVLKSYE
jgi:thioredoxin 1